METERSKTTETQKKSERVVDQPEPVQPQDDNDNDNDDSRVSKDAVKNAVDNA